jgi:NAD-dependent deacetylase
MHEELKEPLLQAIELLNSASRILVLSGAGLSKASGIPTYRCAEGLWNRADTARFSHIDTWKNEPAAMQKFWRQRKAELRTARPNPGHQALARLQRQKSETVLATQNVDGLLTRAGAPRVLELHGNISHMRCDSCGRKNGLRLFSRCLWCGARARPDVVMFGETLDEDIFNEARQAATRADVMVVVGTTALVYPVASLPETALRWGAKLIVINTEKTLLSSAADVSLRGSAEELLPLLVEGGHSA